MTNVTKQECMMNNKVTAVVVVAIVIIAFSTVLYLVHRDGGDDYDYWYPTINEGLFQTESFDITDEETGSWTRGKAFFLNNNGEILIRVFADVHVAPGDFGGISISGTDEIRPTVIMSDFGGDLERGKIRVYQAIGCVMIGSALWGVEPFLGGDGSVIIDYVPAKSFNANEKPLSITVAAGSRIIDDGTHIVGPTHETITVFLNESNVDGS